jgi:hypothetical protein
LQDPNKKNEVKSISTDNKGQTIRLEVVESKDTSQNNTTEASYILIKVKGYRGTKEIYCNGQNIGRLDSISHFSFMFY